MRKVDLQRQAVELIKQLSPENLKAGIDYLTYLQNQEDCEAAPESANDFEIALDEILRNYDRAWKALAKVPQIEGSAVHIDLDDFAPKNIEKALQDIRTEAERGEAA